MEQYKQINLKHFNQTLKGDDDAKAVSWGSKESQEIRFKVLSEIGNLNNRTILDAGCGLGDFYGFLLKNKIKPKRYLGIDINKSMIYRAKEKYPLLEFRVGDLAEDKLDESFDYILASGMFNLKIPDWKKIVQKAIINMYRASRIGMGVNFLSAFCSLKKDKKSYYADPSEILDFVRNDLSPRFILRHDYKPNDFTLYIYKI